MEQKQIVNQTNAVSLVELKQLANSMLPKNSILRTLILSERDYLPKKDALIKLEIFVKLLYNELKK